MSDPRDDDDLLDATEPDADDGDEVFDDAGEGPDDGSEYSGGGFDPEAG